MGLCCLLHGHVGRRQQKMLSGIKMSILNFIMNGVVLLFVINVDIALLLNKIKNNLTKESL